MASLKSYIYTSNTKWTQQVEFIKFTHICIYTICNNNEEKGHDLRRCGRVLTQSGRKEKGENYFIIF